MLPFLTLTFWANAHSALGTLGTNGPEKVNALASEEHSDYDNDGELALLDGSRRKLTAASSEGSSTKGTDVDGMLYFWADLYTHLYFWAGVAIPSALFAMIGLVYPVLLDLEIIKSADVDIEKILHWCAGVATIIAIFAMGNSSVWTTSGPFTADPLMWTSVGVLTVSAGYWIAAYIYHWVMEMKGDCKVDGTTKATAPCYCAAKAKPKPNGSTPEDKTYVCEIDDVCHTDGTTPATACIKESADVDSKDQIAQRGPLITDPYMIWTSVAVLTVSVGYLIGFLIYYWVTDSDAATASNGAAPVKDDFVTEENVEERAVVEDVVTSNKDEKKSSTDVDSTPSPTDGNSAMSCGISVAALLMTLCF